MDGCTLIKKTPHDSDDMHGMICDSCFVVLCLFAFLIRYVSWLTPIWLHRIFTRYCRETWRLRLQSSCFKYCRHYSCSSLKLRNTWFLLLGRTVNQIVLILACHFCDRKKNISPLNYLKSCLLSWTSAVDLYQFYEHRKQLFSMLWSRYILLLKITFL